MLPDNCRPLPSRQSFISKMNLTNGQQNGHRVEHAAKNGHASLKVKTKILLFATYALVLESLGSYLESTGELEVVDGTTSAELLPDRAAKNHYDIVILCLLGDESSGLEIIPRLSNIDPNVRVLILSGSNEISVHQRAVELGASGIVLRQQDGKTLLRAIRQIHEGGTWFNQKLLSQILNNNGNAKAEVSHGSRTRDNKSVGAWNEQQTTWQDAAYQRSDGAASLEFHLRQTGYR
jgi:DNA-binding NarL/FixJ family response regulator